MCTTYDHNSLSVEWKERTICEGSIIGAQSVVTKDVQAWSVVAGNPARVVKNLR